MERFVSVVVANLVGEVAFGVGGVLGQVAFLIMRIEPSGLGLVLGVVIGCVLSS